MKKANDVSVAVGTDRKLVICASEYLNESVAVFRITPDACLLEEDSAKDIYIAVPRGRRVSVSNIPEGKYSLKKI